ncbi:Hypothetical protein FKW44_012907 [Caligus rogercresseyi]|uniref:Uncharacterized protein n=1 Tax=Caligus rogercresseyi TaxID=217165 RepID=A0A7T8HKC9_CALRO|nr:Hypothetical protein FKW44_012907 [Caligus rogercresseyi]
MGLTGDDSCRLCGEEKESPLHFAEILRRFSSTLGGTYYRITGALGWRKDDSA